MSANDSAFVPGPTARPAGGFAAWRSASRGTPPRQPGLQAARRHSRGVAMVEFAIGLTIFLLVVFGIMELALTYFAWNRISEAARDGSRFLIVNAPLTDLSGQSCSAGSPPAVNVACSGGSCAALLTRLQSQAPFVAADNVAVEYRCSAAGNPDAPDENRVRSVTLRISGVPHPQVLPLIGTRGIQGGPILPAVSVTRTGEDLHTPAP